MPTIYCNYGNNLCIKSKTGRENLKMTAFIVGGRNGSFSHLLSECSTTQYRFERGGSRKPLSYGTARGKAFLGKRKNI